MTKEIQEATSTERALDLALEALEHMLEDAKQERLTVEYWNECVDAITAIKQARSAPVQSCYCPNCEAMGKELAALKAQPAVPLTDDWIRSKCKQTWVFETAKQWVRMTEEAHGITAAPVQEPVGVYGHCPVCGAKGVTRERRPDGDDRCANGHTYKSIHATTPPAQQAPVQEPVAAKDWEGAEYWMPLAWELCADECGEEACTELIWEGGPIPEPWGDRWLKYEDEAKRLIALVQKHTTPPAAQRQWVGLTDEEYFEIGQRHSVTSTKIELIHAEIEAKLKEKNNG